MKYTRIAAIAAVGLAATLSLTACGNDGSGKTSVAKGSSSDSSGDSSESRGGSQESNAKPDSGGSVETHSDAASDASGTGGKTPFCKTEDLGIDAVNAAPDETSGRINVTMINRGPATCSATGFPGVDIKDVDHTSSPVERGHAEPRITILKPGDAAVFDIAYDIDNSDDSLTNPTDILVTPPNETHTIDLKWPEGAGKVKGSYVGVQVFPTHTTK
ncbi:DUF4232 domain-containing protein [Streptomyces sp. ITFR-6]|uniref:DUF4232 domain-containing protein n=1 Tax=Streptomyces sp. ITFR-6 TaxID=3075197 RepID=UPI00288B1036|nr:DUF4232 domain-containing protein [Streptomyces sp. ITFR-6]WNI31216.1 DUF4232 domain-containing protein [Streptomyces sp. ITFR-6]